tara:strand:- start:118 stop:597 length:480 start_codon:yes stop_codon:yes gene_type:complete
MSNPNKSYIDIFGVISLLEKNIVELTQAHIDDKVLWHAERAEMRSELDHYKNITTTRTGSSNELPQVVHDTSEMDHGYIGVHWDCSRKMWYSKAGDGTNEIIGYFNTPKNAALAYDADCTQRGVSSWTNGILEWEEKNGAIPQPKLFTCWSEQTHEDWE